jgi:hypothetical protein
MCLLLHSHFEAAGEKILQESYHEFDAIEKGSVSYFYPTFIVFK